MVEQVGNAIPSPSYKSSGQFTTDLELLMESNPGSYHQKGVTLKSGQGLLKLGTLLKQDPTTKKYVRATDNTAEGILRTSVDTGSSESEMAWQGNILFSGILNLALISAANSGVTLTSVLGARTIPSRNIFKF